MTDHRRTDRARPARNWALAPTSLASLMVALDMTVVTTALSRIRLDLAATSGQLEWIVNAYALSFAVLLMSAVVLGDRLGRRRMFCAGIAVFVAASGACALAPGIGLLIAARAVQGVGAALVAPLALALLGVAYPPESRARALGIFGGITGLAVLGGPVAGGAITQGIAWQWIFWLNLPLGLATIALALRILPESTGARARLDLRGLGLAALGALGLVWGLIRGNAAGWGTPEVGGALAAGMLAVAAFVAWELRAPAPMLPMRLFRSRAFAAGCAAVFFLSAALFGAVYFMAQFLQTAQHHGPLGAGLRLLPWTATLFLVAPITGRRIGTAGERPFIVGGLILQAAGLASVALLARPDVPYAALVPALVVAGVGASMGIPATQSAVVTHVLARDLGTASGTFTTLRQLGGAFGIAIAGAVFAGTGGYGSAHAFSDGFAVAMAACAALSLAGAIAGLRAARERPRLREPALSRAA